MFLILLAAAAAQQPPPERHSILVPVGPQQCPPRSVPEGEKGQEDDVVVCATDLPDQTVPLPLEYTYTTPRPSNPDLSGTGALAASVTPCAATQTGCPTGLDVMPLLFKGAAALVEEAKYAARKRDKRPRIPIDISESPAKPAR